MLNHLSSHHRALRWIITLTNNLSRLWLCFAFTWCFYNLHFVIDFAVARFAADLRSPSRVFNLSRRVLLLRHFGWQKTCLENRKRNWRYFSSFLTIISKIFLFHARMCWKKTLQQIECYKKNEAGICKISSLVLRN